MTSPCGLQNGHEGAYRQAMSADYWRIEVVADPKRVRPCRCWRPNLRGCHGQDECLIVIGARVFRAIGEAFSYDESFPDDEEFSGISNLVYLDLPWCYCGDSGAAGVHGAAGCRRLFQ